MTSKTYAARRGMHAPSSRSATAPSASGRPWPRCSPKPAIKGAGFTKPRTSWTPFRSLRSCRQARDPGDLQRRGQAPCDQGRRCLRQAVRGVVPRGRQADHGRRSRAAGVLRLPAEHWVHLGTTNPIESTFATVGLRTRVTKGAGSAAAVLAVVFKLVESAQQRWRGVNVPHLVALVRAGACFERSHLVERPEQAVA